MEPEEAPLKDGDRFTDWDNKAFTVRNVIPNGDDSRFDAHYDDGSVVEGYVWNPPDFTPVTEESK